MRGRDVLVPPSPKQSIGHRGTIVPSSMNWESPLRRLTSISLLAELRSNRGVRLKFFVVSVWLATCVIAFGQAQNDQLLPGETVKLCCAEIPELCVVRTVERNGTIALDGFGDVPAVDMSLLRFEKRVEGLVWFRFGKRCSVSIERLGLPSDPVRVVGLTKSPFSCKWNSNLTLASLMREVPVQDDADASVFSLRRSDGTIAIVDLRIRDYKLRPGDTVSVGLRQSSELIVIVGPVTHPGAVASTPGLTLRKAIESVGGITGHGDPAHIRVRHEDGIESVVDLVKSGELPLSRGDWVSVGVTESQYFVSVTGRVTHPGLVEFRKGMTLRQLVTALGDNLKKAGDLVLVTRIRAEKSRTSVFSLSKIAAHLQPDPVLEPSDSVVFGGR